MESRRVGMKCRSVSAVGGLLLLMTAGSAAATDSAENGARLDWFVGFGVTYGGEKLAEVELDYDGERVEHELRAGNLITITGGVVVYLPLPVWSLQSSIGYHVDEVNWDDGEVQFDRYPLELIPFYNFGKHRIGAGISYHLSPEADLKELGGPKVEFDDALGWLVEYDFKFSGWEKRGFVVGARYMWIDYQVDKVNGTRVSGGEVDGNHVGVHVDFMF
jgi:hypothetical protein